MTDYPIRVLSFGAGVQSTTLLRMMIAGEIEPAQHVVFSDTGWEPAAVYRHLEVMRAEAEAAGMIFHQVSAGNIREDLLDPSQRFASMPVFVVGLDGRPVMARRQCTSEYKLKPLGQKEREIAGLQPGQRCSEHRITTIIGISWDEAQRMKDPLFSWIRNEYPLVDRRITRHDCLEWNRKHGFPLPPRSACIGCPFHSDTEWRELKLNDPESFDDAVEFDRRIREDEQVAARMFEGRAHLHRKLIPLREVDFSNEEDRGQLNLFDQECEGMCGL